jgi:SAM-dependent methyltransferase
VPINVRSPEQWAAISAVMDFEGKTVLDVGCGYGDLLLFAQEAGAKVVGVDENPNIALTARERGLDVFCGDLNFYMSQSKTHYDIVFCFSVLPYVFGKDRTLANLAAIADVAFIEVQLFGDGPGYFTDEDELYDSLRQHWRNVTRVGQTIVEVRNTVRAIWMCDNTKGGTVE